MEPILPLNPKSVCVDLEIDYRDTEDIQAWQHCSERDLNLPVSEII